MSLRALALAITCFFLSLLPSFADEGSRVILVLDASGSMRAKIDGKSKMDIAKQVVGSIIKTWKPEDELGLIAYGHREKGSCEDIEVLREPGPLNAEDYMSAVNGLNPKGKTPMTAAVKMAAESLQYTEKKATVILVSDGIETCGLDPCAIADELENAGVNLTVHTVGFGLDDKGAVAQLKCLAEKTGGIFATANNADELKKALAKTIATKPAPPPKAEFNVLGHVKQAASLELSKPFTDVSWKFTKPPGADGAEGAYVSEEFNVDMKANLEVGDYVAIVQAGKATVNVPFKVEDGKVTKIEADLESGIVKLSAMIDDTTPLADPNAVWDVHTADGKYIDTEYGATRDFMLNVGTYKIDLKLGDATASADIEIKAGETLEKVISLGAGKLRLSATYSEGGEQLQNGMSFEIYQPGTEAGELGKWINTQYNPQSTFSLPAGKYIAIVKLGIAETRKEIDVAAGSSADLVLNANIGFIAATAEAATSYEVRTGKKALDGSTKWLTTTYDPSLNLAANAGSYLVRAFKGDAVIGEKLVEVKAGERTEITLP